MLVSLSVPACTCSPAPPAGGPRAPEARKGRKAGGWEVGKLKGTTLSSAACAPSFGGSRWWQLEPLHCGASEGNHPHLTILSLHVVPARSCPQLPV